MAAHIDLDAALDMAGEADAKWEPNDTELALSILGDEVRSLRARVARLDTGSDGPASTEWGVLWPNGQVSGMRSEEGARREAAATGREMVSRRRGPWRGAAS